LTSNLGIKYLTFSGGSDPSGTETIIDIGSDGSYQDSNYIRIGGGGRNIGVFSGGATFLTFNADYNGSSTDYVYNGSAPAFVIELGVTKGFLRYAPSGIAGNPITIFNALTWNTSGNVDIEKGELSVSTAGKGFSVKGGPNARIGIGATLVGGSVTVNTTAVATGDVILLSCTAAGGVQGFLRISAIVNAVSFTVTSSSALDTSTFSWVIVRPT
jgi:hypothetical protein